jgi:hypothetical protein
LKYLIVTLALLLFGCTKTETPTPQDTLPPITQVGANTAGCIFDGKVLVPKNGSQAFGGPSNYGLTTGAGINFHSPIIGDDYFYVWIQNYKDADGFDIYIHLNDVTQGVGNYIIGQSNGQKFSNASNNPQIILEKHYGISPYKKYVSSINSGTISISRFDYPNGIYSGTFNCSLYNTNNTSEIIRVSNGRFDINIATLNH